MPAWSSTRNMYRSPAWKNAERHHGADRGHDLAEVERQREPARAAGRASRVRLHPRHGAERHAHRLVERGHRGLRPPRHRATRSPRIPMGRKIRTRIRIDEREDVLVLRPDHVVGQDRQVSGPERLDQPEQEPAQHGARDVADPAQHGGGERLDPGQEARVPEDARRTASRRARPPAAPSAGPRTNTIAMIRSISMPMRLAASLSSAVARTASPNVVWLTR